jgi:hypothetical protein
MKNIFFQFQIYSENEWFGWILRSNLRLALYCAPHLLTNIRLGRFLKMKNIFFQFEINFENEWFSWKLCSSLRLALYCAPPLLTNIRLGSFSKMKNIFFSISNLFWKWIVWLNSMQQFTSSTILCSTLTFKY